MRLNRRVTALVTATLIPTLVIVGPRPAIAAPPGDPSTVGPLTPISRTTDGKTVTSSIAETDPQVLKHSGSAPVSVLVKLSYDSVATYAGGIKGLAATSPKVTGKPLSGSAAEQSYGRHVTDVEGTFERALGAKVHGARVGQRLRTVYGGLSVTLPGDRVRDLLNLPGVVALQANNVLHPLSDAGADFIGASSLYPQLGGDANAGKGVIVGVIDTGAWPEHPSFADNGNLDAAPPLADGTPRACDFGDNPLTDDADAFQCNHKLIGGRAFLTDYLASHPGAKETYKTARDSDGHGTHTASTAAGDPVEPAPVLGVDRGPIAGIAPGAWVSIYKACGSLGCAGSDTAAAIQQAIKDGVNVINFSVSGGVDPAQDPTELAFLDAYVAGVFVAASGGNDGPKAGTVNHLSPWVTTVAASTQKRAFQSTLTVTGADGTMATFTGASLTAGAGPVPIVTAKEAYDHPLCNAAPPKDQFAGKIIVCERGDNGRIDKGYQLSVGGATGMVLYDPTKADVETDNHWLPSVHLADGHDLLAFLDAHPGSTAQFTAGEKGEDQGDVMAAFSSRGPAGNFIKPDVTAPGVQILAGNTPTPDGAEHGPSGQYFQAIAGTSMSGPHVAGAGALLKALHPTWAPGQIKSALMTTAQQDVVKEDGTTKADAFDDGAGRIDLHGAGNPGITFSDTADRMARLGLDPVTSVQLNLPSVDAPVMPGRVTTTRTATNVTDKPLTYRIRTTAPEHTSIVVQPNVLTIAPGASADFYVTIVSTADKGQFFGQIDLTPTSQDVPALHLPVAFVPQQGAVRLANDCQPTSFTAGSITTCSVTATNDTFTDTTVDTTTTIGGRGFQLAEVTGATVTGPNQVSLRGLAVPAAGAGVPSIGPGQSVAPYVNWSDLKAPAKVGDNDELGFSLASAGLWFSYNGKRYSDFTVNSNGYLVAGGTGPDGAKCCDGIDVPDTVPPNNVLAPFWSDLDGTGDPGVNVFTLQFQDGRIFLIVEWQVHVKGHPEQKVNMVTYLRVNTAQQDISFAYDKANPLSDPGQPFVVGAENDTGIGGARLAAGVLPTGSYLITSSAPTPTSTSYQVKVRASASGTGSLTSSMTSPLVSGTTITKTELTATPRSHGNN